MDWVVWLLFESPHALGALAGVVLFALLVHWRRSRRPLPLLIGLLAASALFFIQAVVVTNSEHARRVMGPIERELEHGRADALGAALAADFRTEPEQLDREQFLKLVRGQLARIDVDYVSLRSLRVVESTSSCFRALLRYSADVSIEDFRSTLLSTWEIDFVRTPAGWRIREIRCRALPGQVDPTFRDIAHMN